jgi:hypothetical protein
MTDFRALCEELVDNLHRYQCWYIEDNGYGLPDLGALLRRARAALAEDPVGPTDEELDEFAVFWWGSDTDERTVTDVIECGSMTAFARAVLARWGHS